MIYKKADIDFKQIDHKDFERLCYELLIKTGYSGVIWRQGGADQGRDIEGYYNFTNQITSLQTKWYFECKHYSNGVPPEDLNSKIAWADAGRPDYLIFFISSYITTQARTWLDGIRHQKTYKIILIEGEALKEKIIQFPSIVEDFFSSNRAENLTKKLDVNIINIT